MNTRLGLALLFALAFCFAIGSAASAQQTTSLSDSQMPSVITIPAEAQPSDSFSAEAATNAYLAQIPAAARARSDAYFEGGYWLILWDFLLAVIVYWALLRLGWSARMRRLAEHLTRVRVLQNFFYWIQFMLITFVLTFPLTVYEGFFREWKYGLATQTFGAWMGDQGPAHRNNPGRHCGRCVTPDRQVASQHLAHLGRHRHDLVHDRSDHDRTRISAALVQ
jgi:STE24 endopeptidase